MSDEFIKDLEDMYKGKAFLTLKEVAEVLDCTEQVIYHWTRRADPKRRPPRLPVGKELRFPKRDFFRWLATEQSLKAE